MEDVKLGELLLKIGKINEEQLAKALVYQKALQNNVSLGEILIKMNAVDRRELESLNSLKVEEEGEYQEDKIDAEFIKCTPEKLLRDNFAVPYKIENNHSVLTVLATGKLDYKATDEFRRIYEVKKN